MTTTDHADIIARAIADPVAWVPDLFDTDPDLCANSSDGPLFVLGQRCDDPIALVLLVDAGPMTRDEAAQWLTDRLTARQGLARE